MSELANQHYSIMSLDQLKQLRAKVIASKFFFFGPQERK
jgi:hypothetical protein